jgi:hypothetical protein
MQLPITPIDFLNQSTEVPLLVAGFFVGSYGLLVALAVAVAAVFDVLAVLNVPALLAGVLFLILSAGAPAAASTVSEVLPVVVPMSAPEC